MRRLLCFAEGKEGDWDAFCVDFDIAVQGRTFEEVYELLNQSIADYIEAAFREDEVTRKRLLNRRAPLLVRWSYLLKYFRAARQSGDDNLLHGYTAPCAA